MSDPNVNESIEFRVRLNEKEEGEEYNTTSCFISINDSGSYEPYCLVEQRGQLHLYNTGSGDIRTPATLREALVLVAEDTPQTAQRSRRGAPGGDRQMSEFVPATTDRISRAVLKYADELTAECTVQTSIIAHRLLDIVSRPHVHQGPDDQCGICLRNSRAEEHINE